MTRKLPEPRECENCHEIFQPGPYCNTIKFCQKEICQEVKRERQREAKRRAKKKYEFRKANGENTSARVYNKRDEQKASKERETPRICLKCLKPIDGPNMFYHNTCLREISDHMARLDDNYVYMEGEI